MHKGVCNDFCLNAQLSARMLQAEVVPGEVATHTHTLSDMKVGTRITVKAAPEK